MSNRSKVNNLGKPLKGTELGHFSSKQRQIPRVIQWKRVAMFFELTENLNKYLREVGWERSIGNQGNTTKQVQVSTKKCPWLHFESQLLKKIAREILLKKINSKYLLRIYYVSNTSGNTKALWLSCCSQGAYNLIWETIQTFWSETGMSKAYPF